MSARAAVPPSLYLQDETAWLDAMAGLVRAGRTAELDFPNLGEYLTDMANRDRKEVVSRLVVLLTHLLKWEFQPDKRTPSWAGTILAQRQELRSEFESGTLRNHAITRLPDAYRAARKRAAVETGLPLETFPEAFAGTIDEVVPPDA